MAKVPTSGGEYPSLGIGRSLTESHIVQPSNR